MKRPQIFPLCVLALMTVSLVGCGGGGSTPPPPPPAAISVTLSPAAPTSLNTGATASLTAVVSNDSSNAGVKWAVSCTAATGSTCGSFSSATTASGAATTYTAPSVVPSPATVTITATSAADATKLASATITIAAVAPSISVTFAAAPPATLATSATTSITANVANDSANAGVKWTVNCTAAASSTCGSFSSATTASGVATIYTAPSAVPNPPTVTVTATSVTDSTKSVSATITIAAAGTPISVTFAAAPAGTLPVSTSTSITANVANDTANAGVTWTVTCTAAASSTCGSFSSATTASGAATTYTAPSAIPNPATVTITATSVTDTTKSVSATITIAPPILANGTYVYHISGEDATGPYFIVGAIIVQNGLITAGEQDFSDRSFGYTTVFPAGAAGSSISMVGSNVQLTLNTGNTSIGVSGVETLRGPKVSATRVLLSEFDTFASGSGSLDLQTSVAAPSGGYAFSVGGIDGTTNGYALAIGGILNVQGTTIVTAGTVLDANDGGTVTLGATITSGSVTAPDSVGRVTFTVNPVSASSFILTGYIVSANRILLLESQTDTLNADLGGTALAQGTHTGTFTPANVSGTTYVFAGTGASFLGTLTIAANFTLGNASALSGFIALNDMSNFGALAVTGGTYAVDTTGRITISGVTPSLTTTPFGFQLYLDGNGNAMELGVDSTQLNSGMGYGQTNATATPSGNFGLTGAGFGNINNTAPGWSAAGPLTIASSGSATGYTDYNLAGTTPVANIALTGVLTSPTTTKPPSNINLTGLNAASATTANGFYYFSIDGTRFLVVEDDGAQLGILQIETISP